VIPDKPVVVQVEPPAAEPPRGLSSAGEPAEVAAPPEPEAFAAAHRELLADSSIQFDLPQFEPPQPPAWLRWLGDWLSTDHPVLRVLLWVVVGLVVLAILYAIARWLMSADWPWRRRDEEEEPDWRPEAAPARALLGEADALAAQGNFAEAVHLLLFRSLADLERRRPGLLRPALTSRDISGLDSIPPRPRGAFARIAMAVERSLFARRPLGAEDWQGCRAAYEEFAFVDGWRG
jgi:hypothetical protein